MAGTRMPLAIVIPVFDDWDCARALVAQLRDAMPRIGVDATIFLVDDGSMHKAPSDVAPRGRGLAPVNVIELFTNVGHQRAIAIGLAAVDASDRFEAALVMDGDGEDRVEEIERLLDAHRAHPEDIVVAQRGRRRERFPFKPFYGAYQRLFRVLTGRRWDFGNFTLLPASVVRRIVHSTDLWNHYPATLMRSRVAICRVRVDRGSRLFGESRMNFVSLVNHGLSAIAVFVDVVFVRLLAVAIAVLVAAGAVGVGVIAVRIWSGASIPGWAALTLILLAFAVVQIIALLVITAFLQLADRSRVADPPSARAESFIQQVRQLG